MVAPPSDEVTALRMCLCPVEESSSMLTSRSVLAPETSSPEKVTLNVTAAVVRPPTEVSIVVILLLANLCISSLICCDVAVVAEIGLVSCFWPLQSVKTTENSPPLIVPALALITHFWISSTAAPVPGVRGSSPMGHLRDSQAGPSQPASHLQTFVSSASQDEAVYPGLNALTDAHSPWPLQSLVQAVRWQADPVNPSLHSHSPVFRLQTPWPAHSSYPCTSKSILEDDVETFPRVLAY
mmetsp:Transcript_57728/g.126399  ORF Transcript_57728/g.126399 Transcript_57728/m.126399 type:complete len:239 (-) Transcript_57728:307-1023(-)